MITDNFMIMVKCSTRPSEQLVVWMSFMACQWRERLKAVTKKQMMLKVMATRTIR
jgi:hypothetical protein